MINNNPPGSGSAPGASDYSEWAVEALSDVHKEKLEYEAEILFLLDKIDSSLKYVQLMQVLLPLIVFVSTLLFTVTNFPNTSIFYKLSIPALLALLVFTQYLRYIKTEIKQLSEKRKEIFDLLGKMNLLLKDYER